MGRGAGGKGRGGAVGGFQAVTNPKEYSEQYMEDWNNLTDEERAALLFWKEVGYNRINSALQSPHLYPEGISTRTQADIARLDSAIASGQLRDNLLLYRGFSPRDQFGVRPEDMVGSRISNAGFLSTSLAEGVGFNFATRHNGVLLEMRVPRGTRAAFIPFTGAGTPSGEYEMLLPRGTGVRITGAGTRTVRGQRVIVLTGELE